MSRRRHEVLSLPLPATPTEAIRVLHLAEESYEGPEIRAADARLSIWAFGALPEPKPSPVPNGSRPWQPAGSLDAAALARIVADDVPDTPAPADLGNPAAQLAAAPDEPF